MFNLEILRGLRSNTSGNVAIMFALGAAADAAAIAGAKTRGDVSARENAA